MTEITVRRETLHQLAREVIGQKCEAQPATVGQEIATFARAIKDATATRDGDPVSIKIIER